MRFSGTVGYATDEESESAPGVWESVITEKPYFGDVIRAARRLESSPSGPALNDDVVIENSISILADAYAHDNFANMRYVNWNGSNWTITRVEIQRPRLILSIGGLWRGNTA